MDSLSKFTSFLLDKGYQLIENNEQLKFITYEKDGMFIRIEEDRRRERFIILSRTNDHSWMGRYDMDLVRFFILKIHYQLDRAIRFDELSHFLIDHYEEIVEAFKLSNFAKTEEAFAVLQKERAKVLFGN